MPPPTTITTTIARLAALCDGSGLTRAEIAERAGLASGGNVSRILCGHKQPGIETVARILAAIGAIWADLDSPQ